MLDLVRKGRPLGGLKVVGFGAVWGIQLGSRGAPPPTLQLIRMHSPGKVKTEDPLPYLRRFLH